MPWTMINGCVTEYKIDGIIWIPKTKDMGNHGNVKLNYFEKWLNGNKSAGDVFTLEEFYEEYPRYHTDRGYEKRLSKIISGLIRDKRVAQMGKDRFKVLG